MRNIVAVLLLVGSVLNAQARVGTEFPSPVAAPPIDISDFVYGKYSAKELQGIGTLIEKFWRDLELRMMKCAPGEHFVIELEHGWSDKVRRSYCAAD
jgi:hypothetical protein